MRYSVIAASFLATAFALPSNSNLLARSTNSTDPCDENAPPCMTYDQAQAVANNFKSSIVSYSAAETNVTFAVDFVDYSDSVIELIDSGCTGPLPLGQATFTSRANFEAGQGSQPSIPFEILNLWHTCDTVIIRWKSAQTPEQVTGIIVIETSHQNSTTTPFLIQTVYSEFNSGAWLVNLGVFHPTCNSTAKPSKRSLGDVQLPARIA